MIPFTLSRSIFRFFLMFLSSPALSPLLSSWKIVNLIITPLAFIPVSFLSSSSTWSVCYHQQALSGFFLSYESARLPAVNFGLMATFLLLLSIYYFALARFSRTLPLGYPSLLHIYIYINISKRHKTWIVYDRNNLILGKGLFTSTPLLTDCKAIWLSYRRWEASCFLF